MIKVLQILPTLTRGGLETFVMNVYRAIDKTKVQFDFLINRPGGDYENEIKLMGGQIYYVPTMSENPALYYKLIDHFFKEHANDYNAVHMHDSVLSYIDPLKYAKKYGITIRVLHSHSSSVSGSKIHYLFHYAKKPFVKSWATHYLGCSDKANQWFYRYTGVYGKSVFVPNGIDTSLYVYNENSRKDVRTELGIGDKDIVLGHVGRIMWIKNHSFLIDVFSHFHKTHSDSKLIIVGVGPLEKDIKRKVDELGLSDSVIFTGVRADVNRLLQSFDAFVMPSYYEGLPVVLVEAQTSGLPVLCSSTISPYSQITDSYYVLSIKQSPAEWSKKIEQILSSHIRKDESNLVASRGFDIKRTASILTEIYTSR